MTWLLSATGVGGLVFACLWLWEKAAHGDAENEAKLQIAFASDLKRQLVNAEDERARLEKLVVFYKTEVDSVQKDLAHCVVPGSVRERLNRLQAGPGSP